MNARWYEAGSLAQLPQSSALLDWKDFALAIVGPGGTGKTSILRLTQVLTERFAGSDVIRKLAPSNAAARVLGGDTLHALCKLPFGKTRLQSRKGRLASATLKEHQLKWSTAIAAYIDELSMVSADQFFQCDVRMRQAKRTETRRFGGVAVTLCGDFLQLPPVNDDGGRNSLAIPLDAAGNSLNQSRY